ncbi:MULTISPECIES: DsbA family protein [Streptomyces]|uniref:DsbA family protein n=1 Tax=Streptomyces TaxID=1883 RepID=UPI00292F9576|nr:DsbA family protein [Streptomyces sp. NEAU-HV9]
MDLTVLVVPACPHTALLRERLALALKERPDTEVTWREITDVQEAERLGMHGSPTLLINGVDPLAPPGQAPSLSCRVGALPSVDQLRALFTEAAPRN